MHEKLLSIAAGLSGAELLRRVVLFAGREREATVELVGHLAELDARRLHRGEGYGSLFAYCTTELRLAEHAAYNRIEAARLSRRFPAVLDLLADGSLNLSTARLLAPHLRPDNFESLVAQARGRSKREVETLVARVAPRPDVAPSVRKLRDRAQAAPTTQPVSATTQPVSVVVEAVSAPTSLTTCLDAEATARLSGTPHFSATTLVDSIAAAALGSRGSSYTRPAAAPERPTHRPIVTPLAPERYRVQFTVDARTHEKLRRAQDLLRREIPDGDPGAIFDRALTLLLEEVARKKLATAAKPRHKTPARVGSRSRHIPARVKRAVWLRDGGRCAFVAAQGRRCGERVFLEFHHREPYAMGGEATVGNVSLRCRSHNVYEADLAFGPRVPVPTVPVAREGLSSVAQICGKATQKAGGRRATRPGASSGLRALPDHRPIGLSPERSLAFSSMPSAKRDASP